MNKAGPGCGASSLDDLEIFILHREYRPGMAHAFNHSTWEAQAGEFKASLSYIKSFRPARAT